MRFSVLASKSCKLGLAFVVAASLLTGCKSFTGCAVKNSRDARKSAWVPTELHSSPAPAADNQSELLFDTLMRFQLKKDVLKAADDFQELQREMFAKMAKEKKQEKRTGWFRRRKQGQRIGGLFGAQSFATMKIDLGEKGEECIALAEKLSNFTVVSNPTRGWKGYGGGSPDDCVLDGLWKLRFTSGADATFPDSPKRGRATTSQIVNATAGTLTNVIDFEKGKVKGFRVVVEGTARSDTDMDLKFCKVIVNRDSKYPRFFGRITFRLPSFQFLNAFARFASRGKQQRSSGPGFELRYVDENLRMHKTRDGIWFIQTRIEE